MNEPDNGDPVTQCMGVNKANRQYARSLEKLKVIILVRGYFHNKEII